MFGIYRDLEPQPAQMPWRAPGKKAIMQSKTSTQLFHPIGRSTDYRFYMSTFDKRKANSFGRAIDRFVLSWGIHEQWPSGGTVWYGGDNIVTRKAPWEFTFVSVNPLIVLIEPIKGEPKNALFPRDWFASSKNLINYYFYHTEVKYHPEMHWMSPDLKQMPTPLGLEEGGTVEIPLPDGKLVLTQSDSMIYTSRE